MTSSTFLFNICIFIVTHTGKVLFFSKNIQKLLQPEIRRDVTVPMVRLAQWTLDDVAFLDAFHAHLAQRVVTRQDLRLAIGV